MATVPTPVLGGPGARRSDRRRDRDRGRPAAPQDAATHCSAVRPVSYPQTPADTEGAEPPSVEGPPSRSRDGAAAEDRHLPDDEDGARTHQDGYDLFTQFREKGR